MYRCESWTIKKAECRRIDAFELWCWRRLFRVPWTVRRSNQSILKEIRPGCSLEGLMLKLTLQYFGHLMRRADSLGKILMLGKTEGGRRGDDRGWDGWMASLTQWGVIFSKLWKTVKDREVWHAAVHGAAKSWTQLIDWTTTAGSESKESACNAGNQGSSPVLGRSPGERNGYTLQYFCLKKSWTESLTDYHLWGSQRVGHNWETNPLEKTFMATFCGQFTQIFMFVK